MHYKVWIKQDSRMCSTHVGIPNYWPLVKQISREVSAEDQKVVTDLMYEYYQHLIKGPFLIWRTLTPLTTMSSKVGLPSKKGNLEKSARLQDHVKRNM